MSPGLPFVLWVAVEQIHSEHDSFPEPGLLTCMTTETAAFIDFTSNALNFLA